MIEGMERRFQPRFQDLDCQLAAAFHPQFRLTWLEHHDVSQVEKVKRTMEIEVEKQLRGGGEDIGSVSSPSEGDDDDAAFFFGMTHSPKAESSGSAHRSTKSKAQVVVKAWLDGSWKKEDGLTSLAFSNEPALQRAFVKFNIRFRFKFPSSASVERMF